MEHALSSSKQQGLRGMDIIMAVALCAGILSNNGCRTARDNQIDILESELRTQEDYIYELENYIVEYSEKLRQYRCAQMETVIIDNNSSEPDLEIPPRSRSNTSGPTSKELLKSLDKTQTNPEPALTTPEPPLEELNDSPENLEIPELEIGEPIGAVDDMYNNATPLAEADVEGTLLANGAFIPDPSAYQVAAVEETTAEEELYVEEPQVDVPPLEEETAEVVQQEAVGDSVEPFEEDITPTKGHDPERLVISHVFRNSSETEETSSLLSVVEARDASNEPADFNGKVSLMVMRVNGDKPQRVKRWDFTPEETNAAWQSSNLGDGLHLELPLEGVELPTGSLELWVRLETSDGRKLLSQLAFDETTLVSIDQAEEHLAEVDDKVDGASHITSANPLRGSKPVIKTSPLSQADAEPKSEPQWRAATHYSTNGTSSGFATTATAQKWASRPIGSKAAQVPATEAQPKGSQHQWRARK